MLGTRLSHQLLSKGNLATLSAVSARHNGGLSFDLSDETKELQATCRKFAQEEIIPVAGKYDKTMEYPWELIKKAHSVGLVNANIPQEYGGLGMEIINQKSLHTSASRIQQARMISNQQREIQAAALKFPKEQLVPVAAKHDETGEFPLGHHQASTQFGIHEPSDP